MQDLNRQLKELMNNLSEVNDILPRKMKLELWMLETQQTIGVAVKTQQYAAGSFP